MESLSFDPSTKTLSLKKSQIPKPAKNEVLIKVAYAGICGTDLHVIEVRFFLSFVINLYLTLIVHLIPEGLDLAQAALTEPISCLAHGWDRINPVDVGTRVLVIGAGIIGLLWAALLHLRGLRKTVTISEPQAKRRETVKKLGVDYEALSSSELSGREFDLAIDCSGSGPAMEAAVHLLGRGGKLCVFGVANPKAKMSIEPFEIYMKELTVVGVNINPFTFPKGLSLVQAMSEKYLQYEKLGIKVYELSRYQEALAALTKGEINKAVFKL
ncbi:D-arabinitol dehydrogenase 1-like [Orussus abietinus]|uniref:D-arabinitol dehydrogenase 1-like n=1 Tax=Orussus abietinus TaxID=222816 RepID=UPI000C716270|nr:D-arabinitol dehydrogenase 1-like [Orussus abietinus]